MHLNDITHWQHSHTFDQDKKRPGELRTVLVIAITGVMMVVEIAAGILFGSMALLADGLHMASHTAALGISVFAYIYARRHASDARYSFGTGKVNALGGFSGAVLLVIFALLMGWESVERFIHPVAIAYNQAIAVAFVGLIVNGASILILDGRHEHGHGHDHHHHDEHHPQEHDLDHDHHHDDHDKHGHERHGDHNLRAAYFHVLADALTSLLAIFALLAAKYFGLLWMDPLMGILGALLVARWSVGLLRSTNGVLLDRQGPEEIRSRIRQSIERHDDNRVADLHLWSIGPNLYALIVSVITHDPKPVDHYKAMLPSGVGLAHVTVEVLGEGGIETREADSF